MKQAPPTPKRYPVGRQVFSELIEGNFFYIDKTEYVYRMTHSGAKYMFLNRPRRFGKTLLASTLHAYFEGRKELFAGLAINSLETEWIAYPVLRFDMSLGKHMDKDGLVRYLHNLLQNNERNLEIDAREAQDVNIRLTNLILDTYVKYGKQVVVLIDEYDAPLLDVMHEDANLPVLRNVMRNFYSPLKACDPYLRYVFLTGITKFSQLSIFSELNNMQNISMQEEYAAICGVTEEEIRTQMGEGLEAFAGKLGITEEEMLARLKANYDGYHFTLPSPGMYNPYSLMNAFEKKKLASYWFGSGTPAYLIEMLRKYGVTATRLGGGMEVQAEDFDAPTEQMANIVPLLYQSGYLTIKSGMPEMELYTLGIPNREVRLGLMKSLIPYYLTPNAMMVSPFLTGVARHLLRDDMDATLRDIQTFLSTIPYTGNTDYEGHYQQVLYIIFSLLGSYVDVEVRTASGRIDIVVRTASTLYVMELKLDKGADSAMAQINLKHYPDRFALCGLPVVKVGISFDSGRHTLGEWKKEKVQA